MFGWILFFIFFLSLTIFNRIVRCPFYRYKNTHIFNVCLHYNFLKNETQ